MHGYIHTYILTYLVNKAAKRILRSGLPAIKACTHTECRGNSHDYTLRYICKMNNRNAMAPEEQVCQKSTK